MVTKLPRQESLAELLGGRQAGLDATLPPVAFVAGWLLSRGSVGWSATTALAVGSAVAAWRWRRGTRARAVLLGLLGVVVASLIVLRTGRAADFFLVQIVTNAASMLAWMLSITLRWPLLGLVIGAVLGQRTTWRRDPLLLRAYSHGSWIWVGQYALRILVFLPLWIGGQVIALGVARVVLSWPLVAACLAGSWWVVSRALPPEHPGLRYPHHVSPPI